MVDNLHQQSLFDLLQGTATANETIRIKQDPLKQLERLRERCLICTQCVLREGCQQVVFGEGNLQTRLLLVGEGPGADEDRLGRPFVGTAGRLLDRILEAVELKRDELYITNVVKCRPPGNRLPLQTEVEACLPYLQHQIRLIDPAIIICLGSLAARTLFDRNQSITRLRGRWHSLDGRRYMPTFHPAALLRDSSKKRPVWEDFKQVAAYYRQIMNGGKTAHD